MDVLIEDIDDEVIEILTKQAALNNRSLEEEARLIILNAIDEYDHSDSTINGSAG